MESYEELKNQKEYADKMLLYSEGVLGYISALSFLALIFTASYIPMPKYVAVILTVLGAVILAVGVSVAIKLEQIAGYYECEKCHNRYVPSYKSVFFAKHFGRTRHLRCPECGKKSWHKKVLTR
ncbi:MAG: hypothetical protein IKR46_00020 [Clostridia bacterium]|nr:hypothetical protein [Clostridia bacterium]